MPKRIEVAGLKNIGKIYHNLSYDELIDHELKNGECVMTSSGATAVDTGVFTGRSPKDKYFVDHGDAHKYVAWGSINHKVDEALFEKLLTIAQDELSNKDLYITDVFCGASSDSRHSVRFVSEIAWQSHFVKNMFIRPSESELANFEQDFTVLNACKSVDEKWKEHGLNSEVFVVFDTERRLGIIGGTWYGGEMKKGIFSMMNYWLPMEGKLGMHCAANVGPDGDSALFFGLSGTGKTTLSTDSKRRLIGDDEHGWDDKGIFNFEGGCYAKVIDLDPNDEPEIHAAIKRGALLENVVVHCDTGHVDYCDASKTQNTRVSYPIEHIENHEPTLQAGHPKNIILLTADAFGVLPPVSKLTKEQAMYYFLSGYTAKVAGTERGVTEPIATFSSCFGEAFLPLHPTVYAKLLGEKIDKHNVSVYLVNTGWTGGAYGEGTRMSIKATRACIDGILEDTIDMEGGHVAGVFGLHIPSHVPGVDSKILNPRNTWDDETEFEITRDKLAKMFIENFKKYENEEHGKEYAEAGPVLKS